MDVDYWGVEFAPETAAKVFVFLDVSDFLSVATTSKYWNSLVYVPTRDPGGLRWPCHVVFVLCTLLCPWREN